MREDDHSAIVAETGHESEQKRVDRFFRTQAEFWRDTYLRNDVLGTVNRQRQAVALGYVDELPLLKGSRVLEIGCGAGYMAIALAQRGFVVQAVDHAPEMIELARRHVKHAGLDDRVHTSIEDAHKLSFEDESFDLVVSLGVINWLYDLRKALVEITRVLQPGGYTILNSIRAHALLNPLAIPAFESTLESMKHLVERAFPHSGRVAAPLHRYLPKEINRYLRKAKLTVIKSTNVGFGPFTIFNHSLFPKNVEVKIQQKLQKYADEGYPIIRSAGEQYVVMAKKERSRATPL
jgi:ubiquinone/menaquinone biosynthesis C-methylase UbiE